MEIDWTASGRAHAGDDFVAQLADWMRAQPVISYALDGIRAGMYIEHPAPAEPMALGYAWIGYWKDDADKQTARPTITVAATSLADLDNVQDRLGLGRRKEWVLTTESLTFQGSEGDQKVPIYQVRGDRHVAIGVDGSNAFVATSNCCSFKLADQRIITVTDREPFIRRWLDAVSRNLNQ